MKDRRPKAMRMEALRVGGGCYKNVGFKGVGGYENVGFEGVGGAMRM